MRVNTRYKHVKRFKRNLFIRKRQRLISSVHLNRLCVWILYSNASRHSCFRFLYIFFLIVNTRHINSTSGTWYMLKNECPPMAHIPFISGTLSDTCVYRQKKEPIVIQDFHSPLMSTLAPHQYKHEKTEPLVI